MPLFKNFYSWLFPDESPRWPKWVFALFLIAAVGLSAGVRYNQLEVWRQKPAVYFVQDKPLMTTTDAYYWLRLARTIQSGHYKDGEFDTSRSWPDPAPLYPTRPPLPLLLAKTADLFGADVYDAGIYLIPFLASLFLIPLGLYFYRLGMPVAGVLGGLICSFSMEYLTRTSIGRVDTDSLNVFFLVTSAYFILLSGATNPYFGILFAGLGGFSCRLLYLWYGHSAFFLPVLASLILFLLMSRKRPVAMAASVVAFAACSGRDLINSSHGGFGDIFVSLFATPIAAAPAPGSDIPVAAGIPGTLPNPMLLISELKQTDFFNLYSSVSSSRVVFYVGFVCFIFLCVRRFKEILPLLPIFLLGLTAVVKGRRFAMYMTPIIGIGWSVLLNALLAWWIRGRILKSKRGAAKERALSFRERLKAGDPLRYSLASIGLAAVFWILILPMTSASHVPYPSVRSDIYSNLLKLKPLLPDDARIWNFWNAGYALQDILERKNYADGGTIPPMKSYFMAKAYSVPGQTQFRNIVSFIDENGEGGVELLKSQLGDFGKVEEAVVNYAAPLTDDRVFVVYTGNMISQFPSIFYQGTWDYKTGKGIGGAFHRLDCASYTSEKLVCDGFVFDFTKKTINNQPVLNSRLLVQNGRVVNETVFSANGDYFLQILLNSEKKIEALYLLKGEFFKSNFNQMFLLGRYDQALFEEVYNAPLSLRAFRVKK